MAKVIACIPQRKDCKITDTLGQVVITEERYSNKVIWAILTSTLMNWYVWSFLVAKAQMTFHFCNIVSDYIPIPVYDPIPFKQIEKLADELIEKQTPELSKELDKLIYKIYNITDDEIELIEKGE